MQDDCKVEVGVRVGCVESAKTHHGACGSSVEWPPDPGRCVFEDSTHPTQIRSPTDFAILLSGHDGSWPSADDLVDDVSSDVGQSEVATGIAVGELLVVETQEVEDGGVEVVDSNPTFDGLEAELVGGSVDESSFHATAGHPHREAERVMVAAVAVLGDGCPAELAAPDHQGVVEQPSTLQVGQEPGDRLVDLLRVFLRISLLILAW